MCLHRKLLPCPHSQSFSDPLSSVLLLQVWAFQTRCASRVQAQDGHCVLPSGLWWQMKKGLLPSKLLPYPASSNSPFPGRMNCILLVCHSNSSRPTATADSSLPWANSNSTVCTLFLLKMVAGKGKCPCQTSSLHPQHHSSQQDSGLARKHHLITALLPLLILQQDTSVAGLVQPACVLPLWWGAGTDVSLFWLGVTTLRLWRRNKISIGSFCWYLWWICQPLPEASTGWTSLDTDVGADL